MSSPTVTPAENAERISREHEELRQLIDSIATRLESEAESGAVGDDLAVLAEKLASHFASEEKAAGFYAQILEQDARFGPEIKRLTEDHVVLLKHLQQLSGGATPAAELPTEFDRFRQLLRLHEGDENRLMLQAYTDEIGSKD